MMWKCHRDAPHLHSITSKGFPPAGKNQVFHLLPLPSRNIAFNCTTHQPSCSICTKHSPDPRLIYHNICN